MEVKAGHKQTEVGVIPEDWEVKTLEMVCLKIQDGTHFSPVTGGSDFMYVTSKNIGFGIMDTSTTERIDVRQHREIYRRCDVKKDDILLTKDGANTGNAAINNLDEEFSLLSSVAFLRLDKSRHMPLYFLQQILSSEGQRQIKDMMVGNAITRITLSKIKRLLVSTPPTLAEQTAIATVLSDTDALIRSLDRLIAKKHNIKQGAMQELLTGKRRLPGFSGEWQVGKLDKSLKVCHGKNQYEVAIENGAYPILATGGVIGYANQYLCCKPSVLIGRKGTIDQPQYMDQPFWTIDTLFYTEIFEGNSAKFLFYQFCMIDWYSYNEASGVPSLNAKTIENILTSVPSLPEQTAIADILSNMDAEIEALEEKRDKYKAIKQGMMQELLTGRMRFQ